ncbi:MAG: pyridoxal phosphate-dependent aminotransferase [Acidimicrobiia bacterium]|nr:pyridoxal phosphate-dependent aminotransferase [Acidimicrobiia bacterium]
MSSSSIRRISRRADDVAVSATMAITAKASELKAQGRPVIGYGAGEPDFPTPGYIVDAALAAARDPRYHHYTAAGGLAVLKEAVAAKTLRDSGLDVDPSQVVITNGGKHAVYATCQALIDPGDEVLLPAPYWVTYPETVKLAGGVPVEIPTDETTNFQVSVDQLEAARTDRTKMLIFVSPSNPTGAVYSEASIAAIGAWAAQHGIWVMTDEIYEHLVYGDTKFRSMPAVAPEIADRTVIVNGVAKTYAMTGWRVGWLIGAPEVARAGMRLQSHMTSNVNNIAQLAALAAVSGPLDAVEEMRAAFDRRRRKMFEILSGIDGVICREPQGAFYAFPSLQGLLGRPLAGRVATTTLDLAALLLEEIEIAIVPGEAFGAPGYARFSFAMGDDDMVEGLTRLATLVAAG